jgi:PAS domain S-box-containing protein
MKNQQHKILKVLNLRWILALVILSTALLGNYIFVSYQTNRIRSEDQFLNLAHRQTMLFQRSGVFFLLLLKTSSPSERDLLHKELIKMVDQSDANYTQLLTTIIPSLANHKEIVPPDIKKLMEAYLNNIKIFSAPPTTQIPHFISNPNVSFIWKALQENGLISTLNNWVESYKIENEKKASHFHRWILLLLIFDFLLLIALALFIFRPMSQSLERQFNKLHKSEEEFRSMFELSGVGQIQADPVTLQILRVNQKFSELIGYRAQELLSMTTSDITHPDDIQTEEVKWQDVLKGKISELLLEKRFVRKDGSFFWAHMSATVLHDEKGTPLRSTSIIEDITERREAEEALERAEQQLRLVIDSIPAAVTYVDRNARYRFFNKRLCDWFDLKPEDIYGKTSREILGDKAYEMIKPHIDLVFAGKPVHYEAEIPYRHGGNRVVEVSYVPDIRLDGFVDGYIGLIHDITERKKMELSLAQSALQKESLYEFVDKLHRGESLEETYEAAISAILSALNCDRASILLFDQTQKMRFVAFRGLSENYRKAVDGHSPWTYGEKNAQPLSVNNIEAAEIEEGLKNVIIKEGIGALGFIPLISNGELIGKFMTYYNRPHIFSEEEIELALTIGRQLAFGIDRKRSEKAVQEYAEELKRSNKDLEQFAYIASHDLQEPLRIILGYAQIIKRKYPDKLDAKGSEYLEYIMESVFKMQALVKDLLSYSKVGREKNFKEIDFKIICEGAIKNLEIIIKETNAQVIYDNNLPRLRVDETLMTQLFQNLINNAIKFRSPERTPQIHISAAPKNNHWEFVVKDNGIGIASEYYNRIFEIFSRLHTQHQYPGTGIGLAVCKKIAEYHEGKIWVESKFGEGSTFYIALPKENK